MMSQQNLLLRIGGACAMAGAILYIVSFAGHGDLPTHVSHEAALQYIVNHTYWFLMHLGTIVAVLLWVFTFAALAATLAPGVPRALGTLLLPSAILGGLFVIFDYALDGYAFKVLADQWAVAPGERQADLMRIFDTMLTIASGTLRAELLLFYGVSVLLAGLAVALDGGYPRWFGALGAVAGALVVLMALLGFAGVSFRIDFLIFVIVLPLEGLWLLALGVLMWRRAGASSS
jgi:hypothetical protein